MNKSITQFAGAISQLMLMARSHLLLAQGDDVPLVLFAGLRGCYSGG